MELRGAMEAPPTLNYNEHATESELQPNFTLFLRSNAGKFFVILLFV